MPYIKGLGEENEKGIMGYQDFSGGWNADVAPDLLEDNELELVDNAILDERGAFSKRPGTEPFNDDSYDAHVERVIEWPRDDGTTTLLAVLQGAITGLYLINQTTGAASLLMELDDPVIGHYIFRDIFYFTGLDSMGVDEYWAYDGVAVPDPVVPDPDGANDLDPIRKCRLFIWSPKAVRIFATGNRDNRTALYYSEAIAPNFFRDTSILHPTMADGPSMGLSLFGDAMVIFYRHRAWAWKGIDPATDAQWVPLPVTQGTVSALTVEMTPNTLTFLGAGNIVSYHLGLLDYTVIMVVGQEMISVPSKDKVSSVLREISNPEETVATFDSQRERYILAYSDDPLDPRNNKMIIMNWTTKSFVRYTGLNVNDICYRNNGDILIASQNYILVMDRGLDDWDVLLDEYKPVEMEVHTKQYDLGAPFNRKKFHKVYMAARQLEGTREVEVETFELDLDGANGGFYSLGDGISWVPIDWAANEDVIQAALELIYGTIVTVTPGVGIFLIEFDPGEPESNLEANFATLTGPPGFTPTLTPVAGVLVDIPLEQDLEVFVRVDYREQERLVPFQESMFVSPWSGTWGWRDLVTRELRFGGQKLKGLRCQLLMRNPWMGQLLTIYGIALEAKILKPKGVKINDGNT